jgi:hypothetical protein
MSAQGLRIRLGILVCSAILAACGGSGGGAGAGAAPDNPLPQVSGLAPADAQAGAASLVLRVDGSGFIGTSTVDWNGTALPTTYISAAQLTAQVPASDIANVGSASVTVVNPALGGGSSGALNFTISSAMSSGPKLMQFMTQQTTSNNTENQAVVQFSANTTAGNAIWVAVTVSDFDGPHMITVTDTQGNTFTQLDQENDPAPGEQTLAHFYAPHIVGDSNTPDTITVSWGNDDYKGVLITEIGGVTSAPLVGHRGNLQDSLPAGNDITSGIIAVAAGNTPALLLAVSMNTSGGSSDTGGSGFGAPAAGSGFTQQAQFWDYGVNLATLETATITGTSAAGLFDAPDTDDYATVAVVLH